MKISIVLSTYNGSQYIEEQLDSLRNQTYTADEVLISDDCSQDNTVQIIETYIKKYELLNWKLEVNEKNCGWRKNFMNLITSAMGDIVFTCDQDDIWSADKIQKNDPNYGRKPRSFTISVSVYGVLRKWLYKNYA